MLSEDLIAGDRRRLRPVTDAELGVQMTELGLDGVLTDVQVNAEFAIRHSSREQGQEFAFSFGETHLAPRPAQRFVDLCVLRPLGQNDLLTPRGRPDAFDDLISRYGFGDETLCARAYGSPHRLRAVGKAEDHDGSIFGVGAERANPFIEGLRFSVGVEERDIDGSSRSLFDVEFDDPDLGVAVFEKGAESLEDDHVIVDEGDPDRCGHESILGPFASLKITRSGD